MSAKVRATAELLSTETAALFSAAVDRAVDLLRAGELVALPTETVYGLAANALDPRAVARIFETKGRPAQNPIIVHVASVEMARRCVSSWPETADKLAAAFWPGPLTLVLPRSAEIPNIVTASGDTVGVRWPSHPFIQAVIRKCGFPLAAPSANPSNQVSPTNAEHVRKMLGEKIRLVIDGGQSQVGIESTVIDVSVRPPRILRPGMIHAESILAVTGSLGSGNSGESDLLKSPGQLPKHYSPKARLVLWSWNNEKDLEVQFSAFRAKDSGGKLETTDCHIITHTRVPLSGAFGRVSVIPHDPEAFARAIYGELHRCDEEGARLIIVEKLPETLDWQAISDRLNRAAAG